MGVKGRKVLTEYGEANSLYEVRKKHRGERPRCIECKCKVLLVRLRDGYTTCYRHDSRDPKHEMPRRYKGPVSKRFTGAVAPDGARRLRQIRQEAGLSVNRLAKEMHVNHRTLTEWELGERAVVFDALRHAEATAERLCRKEAG